MSIKSVLLLVAFMFSGYLSEAQIVNKQIEKPKAAKTKFGGQIFLGYQMEYEDGVQSNKFDLKRGYLDLKTSMNSVFSARLTTDITKDKEGDGKGDLEMRLKYAYLKAKLPELGLLTNNTVEFGLVHRPFLDFEQSINHYRVQGKMHLDLYSITTSADLGFTLVSLLGGKLPAEYRSAVNGKNAGRYGSIAVGLYNGGGYHAFEYNANKLIEGRITLRPFPETITGLQITYHTAWGKANVENVDTDVDYRLHHIFLSYESQRVRATAQYHNGEGNYKGSYIYDGRASNSNSYSLFAELRLDKQYKWSVFGRYDFIEDTDNVTEKTHYLAGIAYYLTAKSKIVLDYDKAADNIDRLELAVELKF